MISWFEQVFLSGVILFLAALPWLWLWQTRYGDKFSPMIHKVGVWVFCFYLAGLASATGVAGLLFHEPVFAPRWNGILFVDLFLCPEQYLLNVILFLPLGFLVPFLWRSWRLQNRVMTLGFMVSLSIEILQMFCARATDVDDLLMNTMGAVLGYLFFCWCRQKVFLYAYAHGGSKTGGIGLEIGRQIFT